jgi:copper(I)-binding protein
MVPSWLRAVQVKSLVYDKEIAVRKQNCVAGLLVGSMLALAGAGTAAATPAPISASHGWFRYLMAQIPAGGFVTLHNHTAKTITLTGVSAASCGMAMLHRSEDNSGTDRMVMVHSIAIPPHGRVQFRPGDYHIMCMQPTMQVGQTVPVIFHFRDAPDLTVPFKIYGADQNPAKS